MSFTPMNVIKRVCDCVHVHICVRIRACMLCVSPEACVCHHSSRAVVVCNPKTGVVLEISLECLRAVVSSITVETSNYKRYIIN